MISFFYFLIGICLLYLVAKEFQLTSWPQWKGTVRAAGVFLLHSVLVFGVIIMVAIMSWVLPAAF